VLLQKSIISNQTSNEAEDKKPKFKPKVRGEKSGSKLLSDNSTSFAQEAS